MKISAIVAMTEKRVIGIQGQLPWRLPEDLKRFRAVTTNHPVIMGRKTYESIGKPLPNRDNIIITRQKDYLPAGVGPGATVKVVSSLEEALQICADLEQNPPPGTIRYDEVFIIGGAEIYRQAFPQIERLYLTLIHSEFEGDAFFLAFNSLEFKEVSRENHHSPFPFSFLVLDRT